MTAPCHQSSITPVWVCVCVCVCVSPESSSGSDCALRFCGSPSVFGAFFPLSEWITAFNHFPGRKCDRSTSPTGFTRTLHPKNPGPFRNSGLGTGPGPSPCHEQPELSFLGKKETALRIKDSKVKVWFRSKPLRKAGSGHPPY